jgi:hypothetical protein
MDFVKQVLLPAAALMVVLLVSAIPSRALAGDGCLTCHQGLGDKPSSLFSHDIHARRGVTCAGCHGGDAATDDMEQAMNKRAGFLGTPHGDEISLMCARCHADSGRMEGFHSRLPTGQFAELQQSVHGRLSLNGRERIVQCTTCHGAHGIIAVSDPSSPVYPLNVVATCTSCHHDAKYIRQYNPGLAVDQIEKYRTSVHGIRNAAGDGRVAECASCHGSHGILPANDVRSRVYPTNLPGTCASCHSDPERMRGYGIPTDQFEKYSRSVHGDALLKRKDLGAPACNSCHGNHGATPPGVESISKVCGTCHALNADLFSSSPHKGAFDAANLPECETCHGNHEILPATSALLGTGTDAVCSRCHSAGDSGFVIAGTMRLLVDSLDFGEKSARALVEEAEQKGMEIAEAKFRLRDSHQAELEARTMVHSFDGARFAAVVGKGLATNSSVAEEATRTVREFYFRRIGLGVATLIITVLAVSLYVYVRRIERRQAGKA